MNVGDELGGRYRLARWIARGGGGEVWEAEDQVLEQSVALKHVVFLSRDAEQRDEERRRTLREARAAARLRAHAHVVAIYDVLDIDDEVWLVLEYLPSRSLDRVLAERAGPVDHGLVARVGGDVAEALRAAHRAGIVHRDVKPANILLGTDEEQVKLADFGISHLLDAPAITRTHMLAGTPPYMAPEVARGDPSTAASDMYALGATLYEALEGTPPHGRDDNPLRLLHRIAYEPMRPPQQRGALVDAALRLLQVDPDTRPDAETARDVLRSIATMPSRTTRRLPAAVAAPWSGPPAAPVAPGPAGHGDPRGAVTAGPHPSLPPAPSGHTAVDRGRRRWRPAIALPIAAVAVLLVTAVVVAVATTTGRPETPAPARPVTLVGDTKAADPCGLIDTTALASYGTATVGPGPWVGTCTASLSSPSGSDATLQVYFGAVRGANEGSSEVPATGTRSAGTVTVLDGGSSAAACNRSIRLTDGNRIQVEAAAGIEGVDLCDLADTATGAVLGRLAAGGVPVDPTWQQGLTLARLDACALAGNPRSSIPTVTNVPSRGFGGWSCTFSSDVSLDGPAVARFGSDRSGLGTGTEIEVRGRPATLLQTDPFTGGCAVALPLGAGSPGGDTEFVELSVGESNSPPACEQAQAWAADVATRLP